MKEHSQCARCAIPREEKACLVRGGKGPKFCPTLRYEGLIPSVIKEYEDPELREFARLASVQEGEGYAGRRPGGYVPHPVKTRVEEVIEFAKKIGAKRIGVAFCVGLQREAGLLSDLLEVHGFEVVSVCCKVGAVPKETIGVKDEEKIKIGEFESMCNPLLQAEILNREGTDLNVLVGLCVGHDAIFLKRAKAPCTVLAAKDRVTGHNPLAALYTLHSFYRRLKERPPSSKEPADPPDEEDQ